LQEKLISICLLSSGALFMIKHRILFWDDEVIFWLTPIISEIYKISKSIKISYENPDKFSLTSPYSKLSEAYKELDDFLNNENSESKKTSNSEIIFTIYHTKAIDKINVSDFEFALIDAWYKDEGDKNYGVDHIAKNLLSKNKLIPIIIATQVPEHFDENQLLSDGTNNIIIFLNKSEISMSKDLPHVIASMILSTIAHNEEIDRQNSRINELTFENKQLKDINNKYTHQEFISQICNNLIIDDGTIKNIRDKLLPFFQYLTNENYPIKLPFTTASIMLVGHPGTGKSELIDLICKYFSSLSPQKSDVLIETPISADDNPDPRHKQKECIKKLEENIINTIKNGIQIKAKLIIIQIDDVQWAYPSSINDGAMAAFWQAYLYKIKEYLEYCGETNKQNFSDKIPSVFKKFNGKILWLFARNTLEEIGPLFEPLKTVIPVFNILFPDDKDDRKRVVKLTLKKIGNNDKLNIKIDDNALDFLINNTLNLKSREFIGDPKSHGGILRDIINKQILKTQIASSSSQKIISQIFITEETVKECLPFINTPINAKIQEPTPPPINDWYSNLIKETLYTIARDLITGTKYDHNPDNISSAHGLITLRAIFAIFYFEARNQNKTTSFDRIFGFYQGERSTVGISQYLQNQCRKNQFRTVFPPRPGKTSYTTSDIFGDGSKLSEAGISLQDANISIE
jgi:hypothetical protein